MGFPHVQWGNYMCLYQAPDLEWATTDGMFGFVQRLNEWLRDAALNKLDPEDAPLHPPAVYSRSDTGFVLEHDAPEIAVDDHFWVGAAHLKERNKVCFDVTGWTEFPNEFPGDTKLAACLLLNQSRPM